MSFSATVLKIMIASPGDVPDERDIVREVVHEWNAIHSEKTNVVLMPVGWESHSSPLVGERAQAIINKQVLADCDLLIGVFWTKLGSPTGKAKSGTVEEIEEHLANGKSAMLYFSTAPVRLESVDEKQYKALIKVKQDYYKRGLMEQYDSVIQFREKLTRQLAQTIYRSFVIEAPKDADDFDIFNLDSVFDTDDSGDLTDIHRLERVIQILTKPINDPKLNIDNIVSRWARSTTVEGRNEGLSQYRYAMEKTWFILSLIFYKNQHILDEDLSTVCKEAIKRVGEADFASNYLGMQTSHIDETSSVSDATIDPGRAKDVLIEVLSSRNDGIAVITEAIQKQLTRLRAKKT